MTEAIPFYRHDLGAAEAAAFERALADPILTTGDTVARFEQRFATLLGRRHAIAVTSSTAAIHISLLALDIGEGDEVVTTPMAFVAAAAAIIEAGARPVFVDVEADTGNLDAAKVEKAITERTRAILPSHLYGQMSDMRTLREIADRRGLRIVEDATHAIEGRRDSVGPGDLAETACFSFQATKSLTCGEGGAVVTDNDVVALRLRRLRQYGVTKAAADRAREGYRPWDVPELGEKCNLDNLHAAILLPQLDRLEANWQRRCELAREYERHLHGIRDLWWPRTRSHVQHARHLFPVWVGHGRRDELIAALESSGIGVMVNYPPVHLLTYFRETLGHAPGDFPAAERIGASTVSLPLYARLDPDRVRLVAEAVAHALGRVGEPARVAAPVA